ncbi:hypothetical protein FZEAL_10485 [Fusarium zealandicum]|uniref:Uncharacterized protein n=1 Tax=Fusarium zealandicum TaxID=1053134 RepID=A0A8H4U1I9_9HYPO|nr:hypothetical protein FZEAL_10485 [Fusarium zealandicum]
MKHQSENSLPSTESDNSGRDARNCRHTTASSVSCHSDPFVGSDLKDDVQLQDFSYTKPHDPKAGSAPHEFVAERPSRLPNDADTGLTSLKRSGSLAEDRAASEWETIAPDDEFEQLPHLPSRPLRRQGNFNFVLDAEDSLSPSQDTWAQQTRNFELVPRHNPLPKPSVRLVPVSSPGLRSFPSSSSLYSDLDKNGDLVGRQGSTPDEVTYRKARPAGIAPESHLSHETLKRFSKASTSTDDDPFKYDGDMYSGFLRSSAERDVGDALHHAGASTQLKGGVPRSAVNSVHGDPQKSPNIASFYNAAAIRSA